MRDAAGVPVLDCMCGNVLQGRFDPSLPFSTSRGSFWTNCTTQLLASTSESDRKARTRNRCNGEGYETVALISLKAHGETIGLIQLNDFRVNRLTRRFVSLLEELADYIAMAIAERIARDKLRYSEEHHRALVNGLDAFVYRRGPALEFINTGGHSERVCGYALTDLQDPDKWWSAVHLADRARLQRAYEESSRDHQTFALDFKITGSDGVVRWNRAQVTPHFSYSDKLDYYDGFDIDITQQVRAKQIDERHTDRLASLTKIAHRMAETLDTDRIIHTLLSECSSVLHSVVIVVKIPHTPERNASIFGPVGDCEIGPNILCAISKIPFASGSVFGVSGVKPMIAPVMGRVSREMSQLAELLGMKSAMIAPIYSSGQLTHFVCVARSAKKECFDGDDLWFLSELASQVSMVMTNALRYERERRIAETFQRSLLPNIPKLDGVDVSIWYHSVNTDADVGGDFYDVFRMEDGRLGVMVGDVSGKGLESAVAAGQARDLVRGVCTETCKPEKAVRQLNAALCALLHEDSFVAVFLAAIDQKQHTIEYVNAGQEPPQLLRASDGRIDTLQETGGPVLGMIIDASYESNIEQLLPGDFLVVYTDGLTDARVDSELIDFDWVRKSMLRFSGTSADQLTEHVSRHLRDVRAEQMDDELLLVLRSMV